MYVIVSVLGDCISGHVNVEASLFILNVGWTVEILDSTILGIAHLLRVVLVLLRVMMVIYAVRAGNETLMASHLMLFDIVLSLF
jgi:hypothetical protein